MAETLGDVLRFNARTFPNKVAVIYGSQRITFKEHFERSQRTASALHRAGVRKQDRIAVMSQNRPEFLEVYGAGELSGFIVATVNFRLAQPEVKYVLQSSRPRVVFFEEQYGQLIGGLRNELPFVEAYVCFGRAPDWAISHERFTADGSPDGAPSVGKPEDILHLIYTSGTTGRPKGVLRSNCAERHCAELMATEIGILIDDRMQLMMPLFHVGARWLQFATHFRAGAIVLHHDFVPGEVVRAIEREKVTISHMAPTMIQAVLDTPDSETADMSSLHTVCYSAAPMPTPLLRRSIERWGPIFLQLYAMTEGGGTTLHKHQHNLDGSAFDRAVLSSVGQAPLSVAIRIVGDKGEDLLVNQPGEILISTETRMTGYWNDSIATIEALQDGWYRTGDMGRIDENGFLHLVDRKKDMIISGGENIYSREVEEALASHRDVSDCAVIGVPDPYWGEAVRAIVVLRQDAVTKEEDLIEHCRLTIAGYKKPRSILFVEELPRLPSGKINKALLRGQAVGT